jgi:hypothetical protein
MRIGWQRARWPRGIVFLLAALALAVQIVVPPGFMISGGGDGPARIVICTGHGPIEAVADLGGSKAPAPGKKSQAPCAFAGHAAPPNLASTGPAVAVAWAELRPPQVRPAKKVSVGRRLAAPPPARGPPLLA